MATVAVIDDFQSFAKMLAGPLRDAGHEVLVTTVPVDFERLIQFGPKVLVIGIARRLAAVGRPIREFDQDVLGFDALVELEEYPALRTLPILLAAVALQEEEIPARFNYDLFLGIPDDSQLFVPKVEELATRVKTRRKISPYVCPNCKARMVSLQSPEELFCPRCGTAVSLADEGCHALGPEGFEIPCSKELLAPRLGG